MAKPNELPTWATDANYPAGPEPEQGSPTKANYTSGQKAIGWRPDQIPTAQEDNKWRYLVGEWIKWQESKNSGDIILGPFSGLVESNWAPHLDGYMLSSGAGSYLVGLPLIQGGRLRHLSFGVKGNTVANVTIKLNRNVGGGNSTIASKTLTAPAASFTEHRLDHFATVEPPHVLEINALTPALTCATVDFIELGFWPGMEVEMDGFTNAGNNVKKKIVNVGNNTLQFDDATGLVDETGDGTQVATAVCPILTAANTSLWLEFEADDAGIQIFDVRYARDDGSLVTT